MSDYSIEKYQFETGIYRPPSEGGSASLLLRFTRNCPWNNCTFCGMYKVEKLQVRSVDEIKQDIDAMAAAMQRISELPVDELNRFFIFKHSIYLCRKGVGPGQGTLTGQRQQLCIGHGTPQKVR